MVDEPQDEPPPPSAPETFGVCVRDWNGAATAQQLAECAGGFTRELSRYIDLSSLDGLTLGGDYPRALAELDRGYESSIVLMPSNDVAIGIAMTPSVIRDGRLKSHIVLNAGLVAGLLDAKHGLFRRALHTLAHRNLVVAAQPDTDKLISVSSDVTKLQRKVSRAFKYADLETASQLRSLENKLLDTKTRAVRKLGVAQSVDMAQLKEQAQLEILRELMSAFREQLDPATFSIVSEIVSSLAGTTDF